MPQTAPFGKPRIAIFVSYFRPHWKLFAADMFFASLIAASDLAFPMMTKYTIEKLLPSGRYTYFFIMAAAMAALYVARMGFTWFVTYWGHTVGAMVEADMRRDLFAHLQSLPFSFYDNNRTGELMSRVTTDLFEVTELAHHGPEDLFISILTLSGAFILVLRMRWEMAIVLVVMAPILVAHTIVSRRSMSRASRKVKERTAEINATLESSISGARVSAAFANEGYEKQKFRRGNDNYRDARRVYYRAMAYFNSRIEFIMNLLTVAVIAAGAFFIMRGRMTLTELITVNLFAAAFLSPVRRLASFVEQYTTGMAGFTRFVELMRLKSDIVDAPGAAALENVKGNIEYRDVSFSYNNDVNVLRHINLVVEPGTVCALVGPSGGGKTTLCHLLPRFYEIRAGAILIDGKDIRTLTLESLRRNIGIVQQDVFLFAGTVRENIAYGRVDASEDEILRAARRAEIHDDIVKLPDGYDTAVGERGLKLSGGQKQRISIARIFLKNPPILILDEATSALDSATELRIQKALEELSKGRTTLVIAHRLSTIRGAHRILVIDDEGIREEGTHEALLAAGGLYAELYDVQFKGR